MNKKETDVIESVIAFLLNRHPEDRDALFRELERQFEALPAIDPNLVTAQGGFQRQVHQNVAAVVPSPEDQVSRAALEKIQTILANLPEAC
ncbi:MAG: hypothetical protein VB141_12735 [Burkholderia gladioli]